MDELLFRVTGATATPVPPVDLASLELTERHHLQEWVLAHPVILGEGVRIIAFEFDKWRAGAVEVRDRLDVLGVGIDGRLVLAELKRGVAPDTTDLQAIKYAAMASRFDLTLLAEKYLAFERARGRDLTLDDAEVELIEHTNNLLSEETLRKPRIVLLAEGFSPTVTTSAVWLNEMGLDISLIAYRAYRLPDGAQIVTTSKVLPVPNAEDFVARPHSTAAAAASRPALPIVEWAESDLAELAQVAGPPLLQALDRMAESPGVLHDAAELSEPTYEPKHIWSSLGGLTISAQKRFARQNTPITYEHTTAGWRYHLTPEVAERWLRARHTSELSDLT